MHASRVVKFSEDTIARDLNDWTEVRLFLSTSASLLERLDTRRTNNQVRHLHTNSPCHKCLLVRRASSSYVLSKFPSGPVEEGPVI